MKTYQEMYEYALIKKGGEKELKKLLPKPLSKKKFSEISDDRFLSQMTKSIFQAGFIWKVVNNKWNDFEEVFDGFDIKKNARMTDKKMEKLFSDKRLIRNMQKIVTVRDNANMIKDIQKEHGTFANFISQYPKDEYYQLLSFLKENGNRLGGMTSQYFLRFMGMDNYILTNDVVKELKKQRIITGSATSKRSMLKAQEAFDQWHKESKAKYSHISRIVAMQVGPLD